MGIASSVLAKPETNKDLKKTVDYIASHYILTQNFSDMKKLADPDYCDNLVILTSKVIADNLVDQEITYLSRRIEDGMEVNDMTTDNVIYAKQKQLDKLDVKSAPTKERMCIGIAKFYVKIAHIFAAIITTVNPRFYYTDSSGVRQSETLQTRERIPVGVEPDVVIGTLCKKRYNALVNNQNFDINENDKLVIKPLFCGMNYDVSTGRERDLAAEQGIPELETLYYDRYNYLTGRFDGMTDKMRNDVYNKDLLTFYQVFTGRKEIPKNTRGENTITRFSQIPLRDFHSSEGCVPRGVFRAPHTGSLKDKLFREYAENAAEMLKNTETNQNKLLEVIDTVFAFRINTNTERNEIVIHPALDTKSLQDAVETTRKLIVDLYVGCEQNFIKGINIFESIVGKQILDSAVEREKQLKSDILERQFIDEPARTTITSPTASPTESTTASPTEAPTLATTMIPRLLLNTDYAETSSIADTIEHTQQNETKSIPPESQNRNEPYTDDIVLSPVGSIIGNGALRVYG